MADMPPDYARTEFGPISVHRLADDLAMLSGGGVWKNAANEDLMPFGMTYTLRRTGQTWRIVVAAIHAPDGGLGRRRLSRLAMDISRATMPAQCDARPAPVRGQLRLAQRGHRAGTTGGRRGVGFVGTRFAYGAGALRPEGAETRRLIG